jgi:hypothetical protein
MVSSMTSTAMSSRSGSAAGGSLRVAAAALCLGLLAASAAQGSEAAPDQELRALKQELVALNRDLFLLEEELLFPASTQVAVYLSMDVGRYFALDAVELSLNGRRVAKYLYTEREVDALHRGGVHRLYLGNLKTGQHEVVAVLTGRGPQGREYRRAAELSFEKGLAPQQLELVLRDSEALQQPQFQIRGWE